MAYEILDTKTHTITISETPIPLPDELPITEGCPKDPIGNILCNVGRSLGIDIPYPKLPEIPLTSKKASGK